MELKNILGRSQKEMRNRWTGNRKKGDPCYKVPKNLAELCSSVGWKEELVSNETKYLEE
jgi:hypothetical protein